MSKTPFQTLVIVSRAIKAVAEPWFEDSLEKLPDTPENLKNKEKFRLLFSISVELEAKKCVKELNLSKSP